MAVMLGLPRYCWIVCHPICFEHVLLVWWTEHRETVDVRLKLRVVTRLRYHIDITTGRTCY
jgi:hypothetical protein